MSTNIEKQKSAAQPRPNPEPTQPINPMELELNELRTKVESLEQENASLKERLRRLPESAPHSSGASGYLVLSPNPAYAGVTDGIQFRAGVAFIPDGEGADEKAKSLRVDFGYQVQHVNDWRELREAGQLQASFVDVIS